MSHVRCQNDNTSRVRRRRRLDTVKKLQWSEAVLRGTIAASTPDSSADRGSHLPIRLGGRQARTYRRRRTVLQEFHKSYCTDTSFRFDTSIFIRNTPRHISSSGSGYGDIVVRHPEPPAQLLQIKANTTIPGRECSDGRHQQKKVGGPVRCNACLFHGCCSRWQMCAQRLSCSYMPMTSRV
jgi:hypothetical protein